MKHIQIDVVSDIVCPWCAIGLAGLERAVAAIADVAVDLRFHPLQLNPGLPPEGEAVADNMARKYGVTPADMPTRGAAVREAAAVAGVSLAGRAGQLYDTFDAHRLLYWAAIRGRQLALKKALLAAYFEAGLNVSDRTVLVDTAARAGLDRDEAVAVLDASAFADEVLADETYWRSEGVASVPTVVVDQRYVIQGAQTAEKYERALRRILAE